MNIQHLLRSLTLLGLLTLAGLLNSQCHQVDTSNPIKVDWESLDCSDESESSPVGKYVEIDGHLHAPAILLCNSKECQIDLFEPGLGNDAKNVLVMLPIVESALPNSLRKLPSQYEASDFLVWDETSQEIGHNQMATLYGELIGERNPSGTYNCKLQEPIRIIKKGG